MKRNKLFFATPFVVLPLGFGIASCANTKYEVKIADDAKTMTLDLINNPWVGSIATTHQYVPFKVTLSQSVKITYEDETQTEIKYIEGLPWITDTSITIKQNKFSIDKDNIFIYPEAGLKTCYIYVPYFQLSQGDIQDGEAATLSCTINFYKGTQEQYDEDKMDLIPNSTSKLESLKIVHKGA